MIDTHTHLDQADREVSDVVNDAQQAGVRRLLTVGLDVESSRTCAKISEQFESVYFSAGLHPSSTTDCSDEQFTALKEIATHENCRAIGETGLDYYREYAPQVDQERGFLAQVEIARDLDKPLVIHSRAADHDTLEILGKHASGLTVIIHCFSLTDHVATCIERDYYCSFAGNVTYPNAGALRESAALIPEQRILVETDAPYLSPQPRRGKSNESANVTFTAETVAEVRGMTYVELEKQLEENAKRIFGW